MSDGPPYPQEHAESHPPKLRENHGKSKKIRSCLDRCKFRASSISRRSVLFLAGFLASAQTKYFLPTKAAPIGPWPCQVHLEWSLHGMPRHAVASPKLLFRLCAGTCSQDGEEQTNAKNCSENQILTISHFKLQKLMKTIWIWQVFRKTKNLV